MTTNFMDGFLTPVSFVILPSAVVTAGLGALAVVCEEGTSPVVGGVTSATDADGVATLLSTNVIDAFGAAQATAALSQIHENPIVWIGTHTAAQTPADALDNLVTAEVDFGTVIVASVADADIAAVGTWLSTDDRALRYFVFAETRNADAITATKPAALSAAALDGVYLLYGAAAQGTAGAMGGEFAARGLANGPASAHMQLSGTTLPGSDGTENDFAYANDIGIVMPVDNGVNASKHIVLGTLTYAGVVGLTAQTSLLYTVRAARAGITALVLAKSVTGPLLTDRRGQNEVVAAINGQLGLLAAVGHYVTGTTGEVPNEVNLPKGYRVTARKVGTSITADILVRFGSEVKSVSIVGIGEVG